ncbi:MAG: hypothetical protein R3D85_02285 [Paracoccaceae bacterium]
MKGTMRASMASASPSSQSPSGQPRRAAGLGHHGHADADGEHIGPDRIGPRQARFGLLQGGDVIMGDRIVIFRGHVAGQRIRGIGHRDQDAGEAAAVLGQFQPGFDGRTKQRLGDVFQPQRALGAQRLEPPGPGAVDLARAAFDHLLEQPSLVAEMIVDQPLGDAGALGDLAQGGTVIAGTGEDQFGGVENGVRAGNARIGLGLGLSALRHGRPLPSVES